MNNRLLRFCLVLLIGIGTVCGVIGTSGLALSQETIPRALLVDIARRQYSVMCQSEIFTQCLGFSSQACIDLSEKAISQCLLLLPSEIGLNELENDALESCPQGVFAEAGFSEEKAGICIDKAMQAEG